MERRSKSYMLEDVVSQVCRANHEARLDVSSDRNVPIVTITCIMLANLENRDRSPKGEMRSYRPPAVGIDELSSARVNTLKRMKMEAMSHPHVMGSSPKKPKLNQMVPTSHQYQYWEGGKAGGNEKLTSQAGKQPKTRETECNHGIKSKASRHVLIVTHLIELLVFHVNGNHLVGSLGRAHDGRRPFGFDFFRHG